MSEKRRHSRPRKRSKARVALIVVLSLLLLLAGGAFATVTYLQGRLDAGIERIPDPFDELTDRPTNESDDGAPVNVLVLGSDSRISAGDPNRWRVGAQRTDAIMLAQVSGDRKSATLMSIPRDSWVDVPGYGMSKINAAFSYGGPSLMIQTVEQLTGVRIDHFAVADFESFSALTDELGGVEITLTQPLQTSSGTLQAGAQLLDGEQALQYARERYNVAGGDFGRVQRQQNWMRAIMAAAFDRDVLTNPGRLMSFLETVTESVAVDEGFTIGEMRDLAVSARELRPGSVTFITAPYSGTGRSPDGRQSIVLLDEPAFDEVALAFAQDRISAYLAANPGAAPGLGDAVS
ncbi:MAG: LCP family protein [Georgenia sp.]